METEMFSYNSRSRLANTSRRHGIAAALVFAIAAIVRFFSPAGEENGARLPLITT